MEQKAIIPVLDTEKLQQKANEYAQKGAEEALKDFYTGYNSPYKKAMEENLINKGFDNTIEIPDIIGILNESISKEIDLIANNAVAKTFIPRVKNFLTRAEAELNLSDILKKFINYTDFDREENDFSDYSMEVRKDDGSFLYLIVSGPKVSFEIHFYLKSNKGETPKVYEIYTLPYIQEESSTSRYSSRSFSERKMKISVDGGTTLEIPFTPGILEDDFMSYIAKLIIANTRITFDVTEFDEDMFPEDEGCHCD